MNPVNWSPGVTLEDVEKQVIINAYKFYRGNATQTAISLGISEKTIRNKLEKYEQDGKAQRDIEDSEAADRENQLKRARGIVPTGPQESPRIYGTDAGVHSQPSFEAPEKHAVPVQEPEKVQSVLPKHASTSGSGRRR